MVGPPSTGAPAANRSGLERLARFSSGSMAPAAATRHHRRRAPTARVRSRAFCTAMLAAAGYRVGTFTSPHLRDYRERIRIEGARRRQRGAACGHSRKLKRPAGRAGDGTPPAVSLTFFEYNALAAILIFESARLDAWVLEVGMGGRLDAVNVVDPSVAVVVSIGFDHQEFLGSTLEAIAREKAGIFRPRHSGSARQPRHAGRSSNRCANGRRTA